MPKQLPRRPRAPTLEERAAAREAAADEAIRALAADPENPDLQAKKTRAVLARGAHRSAETTEALRLRCLELIKTERVLPDAVARFAEETGLSRGQSYEWARSCYSDRSVPLELARLVYAEQADVVAADARAEKDFVGACRAIGLASRLRGISDKVELSVRRGIDEQEPLPPEIARLLEPALARVYALWTLAGGRRVFANAELDAFEQEGTLPAGLLGEAAHAARALGLPVAEVMDAAPPALTAPEGWRSARPPLQAEKMLGGGRASAPT